ncbi:hypothetical protein ACH4YO_40560 [Streptomyces noursei]|uniref:hypothetical protein n=1 Tax=Streptomyces noursei TaxID=1971 RepID=UPI0033F98FEF
MSDYSDRAAHGYDGPQGQQDQTDIAPVLVSAEGAEVAGVDMVAQAVSDGAPRNLGSLGRKAQARGWECSVWRDSARCWRLVMKGLWLAPDGRGDLQMTDVVAEAVWNGSRWGSGTMGCVEPDGSVTVVHSGCGYRDMLARVRDEAWTLVDRTGEREQRTAQGRDAGHWCEVAGERSADAAGALERAQVALDAVTARRGEAAWVAQAELEGGPHYRAAYRIACRARDVVEALMFDVSDTEARGLVPDARRAFEMARRVARLAQLAVDAADRLEKALLAPEADELFAPLLAAAQAEVARRDAERLAAAPGMNLETFLGQVRGILSEYVRQYADAPAFVGVAREQWGAVFDAERERRFEQSTAEGEVWEGLWDARDRAVIELAGAAGHEEVAEEGRALDVPGARVRRGERGDMVAAAWRALTGSRIGMYTLRPWRDMRALEAMLRDGRVPAGPEAAELRRALLLMVAERNRSEARRQARVVMEKWEQRRSEQPLAVNVVARGWALAAGCGPVETYRRELRAGWARITWFKAAFPCPVVRVEGRRVVVTPVGADVSAGMLAHRAAQVWASAAAAPMGEEHDPTFPRWVSSSSREIEWGVRQREKRSAVEREEAAANARAEATLQVGAWLGEVVPGAVLGSVEVAAPVERNGHEGLIEYHEQRGGEGPFRVMCRCPGMGTRGQFMDGDRVLRFATAQAARDAFAEHAAPAPVAGPKARRRV